MYNSLQTYITRKMSTSYRSVLQSPLKNNRFLKYDKQR